MLSTWMKPIVYYPVIALASAVVILIGLSPQWPPPSPTPQLGVQDSGKIMLLGANLAVVQPAEGQYSSPARDPSGAPIGLRIAVDPNRGEPTPAENGLVVPLDPSVLSQLEGRAVEVQMAIRPIPVNMGYKVGVALIGSGPHTWATATFEPIEQVLTMQLPAQHFAGTGGLGLRMISTQDAYAYGVEIAWVQLIPQ